VNLIIILFFVVIEWGVAMNQPMALNVSPHDHALNMNLNSIIEMDHNSNNSIIQKPNRVQSLWNHIKRNALLYSCGAITTGLFITAFILFHKKKDVKLPLGNPHTMPSTPLKPSTGNTSITPITVINEKKGNVLHAPSPIIDEKKKENNAQPVIENKINQKPIIQNPSIVIPINNGKNPRGMDEKKKNSVDDKKQNVIINSDDQSDDDNDLIVYENRVIFFENQIDWINDAAYEEAESLKITYPHYSQFINQMEQDVAAQNLDNLEQLEYVASKNPIFRSLCGMGKAALLTEDALNETKIKIDIINNRKRK
jgi:hypothetical protein